MCICAVSSFNSESRDSFGGARMPAFSVDHGEEGPKQVGEITPRKLLESEDVEDSSFRFEVMEEAAPQSQPPPPPNPPPPQIQSVALAPPVRSSTHRRLNTEEQVMHQFYTSGKLIYYVEALSFPAKSGLQTSEKSLVILDFSLVIFYNLVFSNVIFFKISLVVRDIVLTKVTLSRRSKFFK